MEGNNDREHQTRLGGKEPPGCRGLTLLTCIASHGIVASRRQVFLPSRSCRSLSPDWTPGREQSINSISDIFLKTILSTWTADSSAATVQAASHHTLITAATATSSTTFQRQTWKAVSWKFPSLSAEPVLPSSSSLNTYVHAPGIFCRRLTLLPPFHSLPNPVSSSFSRETFGRVERSRGPPVPKKHSVLVAFVPSSCHLKSGPPPVSGSAGSRCECAPCRLCMCVHAAYSERYLG